MQVVQAPDSRLRVQTKLVKKVTPTLLETIKEMVKLTKTFKDPEGVGLAATQIGKDERYFVAKHENKFYPVFNPQILSFSKNTKLYFEGCLSIPDYYGEVKRHLSIKVKYIDEKGKEIIKTLRGVDAWIFQHEIDHLDGILFVDRVMQQKGRMFKFIGRDKTGTDNFEEVTI